jgi:hypothetical protein
MGTFGVSHETRVGPRVETNWNVLLGEWPFEQTSLIHIGEVNTQKGSSQSKEIHLQSVVYGICIDHAGLSICTFPVGWQCTIV